MSKKKKDLFDFTMENMALNVGITAGAGVVGKLGQTLPSPVSGNIMKGMETMSVIPTIHATGGIFNQLQDLNKMTKKKRR